jgi:hypothetical protein
MLKRKLTCLGLPTKEAYMIIHVMEAQKLAELRAWQAQQNYACRTQTYVFLNKTHSIRW